MYNMTSNNESGNNQLDSDRIDAKGEKWSTRSENRLRRKLEGRNDDQRKNKHLLKKVIYMLSHVYNSFMRYMVILFISLFNFTINQWGVILFC